MAEGIAISESSILDIVQHYESRGFTGQFSSRHNAMVKCHGCGETCPAEQVPLEALHRLEGDTDPSDEAAVAALECPACGGMGTLVLSYGAASSPEDAGVLSRLLDDRDSSGIHPGE